jgi:hydroxyacylglutathione hydrolase
MTTDFPAAPKYFSRDAEINRRGARMLSEITAAPLTAGRVREEINRGAVLLDVRDGAAFGTSHISGAINIGLGGEFASWCGTLLPAEAPIVISADSSEHANEAVMRLARVGIESAAGYITECEGLDQSSIPQITVEELHDRKLPVLDVRRKGEYSNGHVPGAQHIPLDELPLREGEVKGGDAVAVICASGYRSSIASSLLQRDGIANVFNVVGGTSAWIRSGFSVATETRQT